MQCKSHVACATADVKNLSILTRQNRPKGARGAIPPETVDVHRQYVIQQVISRRDGTEHLAHGNSRRSFITRAHRCGTDNPPIFRAMLQIVFLFGHAFDKRWISATASRMALTGTVSTTSALPIDVAKTKWSTPPIVFLSDRSSLSTRFPVTSTSGSDP